MSVLFLGSHFLAVASTEKISSYLAPGTFRETYTPLENIQALRYTNRAQCALDATLPTKKVFAFVDSYIVGKVAHNLGKNTTGDPIAFAQEAMLAFRLTMARMIQDLSERMSDGRLPLLPTNLSNSKRTPYTKSIEEHCAGRSYCSALDPELNSLWNTQDRSTASGPIGFPFKKARALDCRYIKNFSAFQSTLFTSSPEQETLRQLAESSLSRELLIDTCESPSLDSRHFILLLSALPDDSASWNKLGFDYWNSLRIYFSWAWRNLDLESYGAGKYAQLFRSLSVEETILFVPEGCKSFIPPSCDSAYLSLNAIRDLAGHSNTDVSKELPAGPQENLIKNPTPPVNSDIVDLQSATSPQEWLKNFSAQANANSLRIKNRFNESLNQLALVTQNLPLPQLEAALRSQAEAAIKDAHILSSYYYMCSEYNYAANQNFGILRDKLELIKEFKFIKEAANPWSVEDLRNYHSFYKSLSKIVLENCQKLERENAWDNLPERIDQTAYSPWYLEVVQSAELAPSQSPSVKSENPNSRGLLSLKDPSVRTAKVVCQDEIACARLVLSSVVGVYSAILYGDSMLPFASVARGASIFNPYAERGVCKVYDPWFKTRAAIKELLVDLANTVAFGWNNLPVFASIDIKHGDVINLKTYINDGKLKFSSIKEKDKVIATLGLDLSALSGVPCVVAIRSGQGRLLPGVPYTFQGISGGVCVENEKHHLEVDSNSASNFSGPARSGCFSCYVNFASIDGVASVAQPLGLTLPFNPIKLGVYLFRSLARFHQSMTDANDVPRVFNVDIDYVTRSYLRHGYIPKKCVGRLKSGLPCEEPITCEAKAADELSSHIGGWSRPLRSEMIDEHKEKILLANSRCGGLIELELKHRFQNCALGLQITKQKGTGSCAALLN